MYIIHDAVDTYNLCTCMIVYMYICLHCMPLPLLQAAGVRLGTLVENVTGMLLALIVAFAYSWIMAIVVLALMPVVIFGSALHFSLSAGSTKRASQALKDSTEVHILDVHNCSQHAFW